VLANQHRRTDGQIGVGAMSTLAILDATMTGKIIGVHHRLPRAKQDGLSATATFTGPITRTAVMSAARRVLRSNTGVEFLRQNVDDRAGWSPVSMTRESPENPNIIGHLSRFVRERRELS
jgi:hypothetical protein